MKSFFAGLLFACIGFTAHAEQTIGSVSTNFRLLGPNDKVVVERFDDPKVPNVACYASFAQTGGMSGGLGVATNPSQFALNAWRTARSPSRPICRKGGDRGDFRVVPVQAFYPRPYDGYPGQTLVYC